MSEKESQVFRVVVGADLSETGDHALREGVRLTKQIPGAELHITYVIRTERGMHDATRLAQMSSELRSKIDELRGHVTSLCAPPSGSKPFSVETVFHIRIGEPAAALHQVAVDVDADMIVVGTHGRKGMEKLLLGSVAEELVRMARVPVVVAHPKDFAQLKKTERMDPARPGEDLRNTGLSDRLHLEFVPRISHISGLV